MEIIYRCPSCQQELEQLEKSFICKQKHTYDISKEGYVNLLLANQKKTKDPGDNQFMIAHRKYFLEQGYYDPLTDKINEIILMFLMETNIRKWQNFHVLDAGCGVGIYSDRLRKYLDQHSFKERAHLWGIDISKSAIQKAAKSYSEIQFCIGSTFDLPYLNESLDFVFSIFSPFDPHEVLRVLKPGGKILIVRPGTNHLQELGALIYERFQLQGNSMDLSEDLGLGLAFIERYQLQYKIHMKKNEDIMSLVAMTPYYWHLDNAKKKMLSGIPELNTGVHFQLSLFQKDPI